MNRKKFENVLNSIGGVYKIKFFGPTEKVGGRFRISNFEGNSFELNQFDDDFISFLNSKNFDFRFYGSGLGTIGDVADFISYKLKKKPLKGFIDKNIFYLVF